MVSTEELKFITGKFGALSFFIITTRCYQRHGGGVVKFVFPRGKIKNSDDMIK